MLCVGEFYLHVDDKYSNRSFFFSPCRRMDLWTKENLKKLIEESDSVNLNEIVDKLDENESKSMINFDEIRANISRLWLSLDRTGDGKITVEDVQIILKELGLDFVSKHMSQSIFKMIDLNKNGELDMGDLLALIRILIVLL